jgi:hypothetical protein
MWYVTAVVWIAVMVFIISRYNRKQRQRGAERATQMAALLADLKANPRAALDAVDKPVAPVTAAANPEFSKKQRLLPQRIALLYYVFRTGLPDHEIFAGLALGDVLDVASTAAGAPREQLARRLAQQRLDLVVCTKQLEIIAAVVVSNAVPGPLAEGVQFATQCLQAAGVRVVSVDPAALPRHHQVRSLIYG